MPTDISALPELLSSTAPAAVATATLLAALRKVAPKIDGPLLVVLCAIGIALLLLLLTYQGAFTVPGVAQMAGRALLVALQAFGGVNLIDRLTLKGAAALGAARKIASTLSS